MNLPDAFPESDFRHACVRPRGRLCRRGVAVADGDNSFLEALSQDGLLRAEYALRWSLA